MSYRGFVCIVLVSVLTICSAMCIDNELREKRSYCVGLDIGQNLKGNQYDLNIEKLIEGLRDAYTEAEWKVQKDEMIRVINEYRQVLQQAQMQKQQEETMKNSEEGVKFLEENAKKQGITVLPSGLQYKVTEAGSGNSPTANDQVKVHYKGTLIDGTEFDSSYSRGEPVTFGVTQVIKGWTEALMLMKQGAKWQVYIPSDLAYGPRGAGQKIGPNATLIFDIELLEIIPGEAPAAPAAPVAPTK